jgi:hypothetical protein
MIAAEDPVLRRLNAAHDRTAREGERLEHRPTRRVDAPELGADVVALALVGAVPELVVREGHARDEAVGLDGLFTSPVWTSTLWIFFPWNAATQSAPPAKASPARHMPSPPASGAGIERTIAPVAGSTR